MSKAEVKVKIEDVNQFSYTEQNPEIKRQKI
jgi:hypothetical protein